MPSHVSGQPIGKVNWETSNCKKFPFWGNANPQLTPPKKGFNPRIKDPKFLPGFPKKNWEVNPPRNFLKASKIK